MPVIKQLFANQILDSRGIPTVQATLVLDSGHGFTSAVPSGTSTGKYEAVELRDNDDTRYFGMEVTKAVNNVNTVIAPKVLGMDPTRQTQIDQALINLDGTANKSRLGANAILSVSQVVCKAGAAVYNLHLFDYLTRKYTLRDTPNRMPAPIFNVINGGKHGAGNLDFQEFHIIPTTTKSYPEALRMGVEIYHSLERVLIQRNASHSVGIEGGFAPLLYTNKDALELITEAIRRANYTFGKDVFLGLDVAANHFFVDNKYQIKDESEPLTSQQLLEFYKDLNESIHLFSIEDPFTEDDWKPWQDITTDIGHSTLIVGDDLLATNKERLNKAVSQKACNTILVKPNQIGTISETVEVIKLAKDSNLEVIASHRSGDTTDTFMADFAFGTGCGYIKFGAPSRGERVVKYNRLLEIFQLVNPTA